MSSPCCLRVFTFNFWTSTDFNETWYERHATEGHPYVVLFVFIQQVIITWRTRELVMLVRQLIYDSEIIYNILEKIWFFGTLWN
jgi:hypothetical protein